MRRLPPLDTLRAFEAIARHESFAKAADELAVIRVCFQIAHHSGCSANPVLVVS